MGTPQPGTLIAVMTAAVLFAACDDAATLLPDAGAARCRTITASPVNHEPPPISWRIASDTAGRRVLDAYCAGVGPALMHTAQLNAQPSDTLAIIGWNMALGEGNLRRLVTDLRAGTLTGAPVRNFVLLLQEVPRSSALLVPDVPSLPAGVLYSELDRIYEPDIVTLAQELGLHFLYVPSMRNGLLEEGREDSGNAIASTLPLSRPQALELPAGLRRRVATVATIAWPRTESSALTLVSAHLDNFSFRRLQASLGAIRARQAGALTQLLPSGPVLLGADLNTWRKGRNEAAYRILHAALPRPAQPQPKPTASRVYAARQLDYLMLRAPASWSFEHHRVDDRYGSDHHPLLGLLYISNIR